MNLFIPFIFLHGISCTPLHPYTDASKSKFIGYKLELFRKLTITQVIQISGPKISNPTAMK